MKHLLTLLTLVLLTNIGKSQESTIGQLTQEDIDLFRKIEAESDPERIVALAIDLVFLSDDKAPLPLLEEAKMLYDLSQRKKNASLECIAMSLYAQGYRITGDFTKSQQYHYKAINIAKKLSDYSLLGYALNQSAHMYKDREENDKAIAIYKEASETAKKGSEPFFKFYPVMNLGFVHLQANNADSAMFYSAEAVNMLEDILLKMKNDKQKSIVQRSLLVYCLSNLAGSYSMLKDTVQANNYYGKALAILKKYQGFQSRYFQFTYFSLAKHYERFNKTDSAIDAAKMAIESVSNGSLEYLAAKPAKLVSDYYEKNNADSAVKYLKIYLKGNEVMNSTRVTQQLQMKAVEEEQRRMEMKQAEKDYINKITVELLGFGLMAMLLLALYMFRSNQQRKKINNELQNQKTKVEDTLNELKSTQTQLIHSEKMASLGELTAGIAHEIQNPLNFINNFSEVNRELLAEMQDEIDKGNIFEAKKIAIDVIANEEKINHHGKRADAIVKGMLQHSQSGSGKKEPTNINALTDEYLRLAYHGLRAKDKSFNAIMKTEFDENIGSINIISQDIGRVLLNLINNAFYVVHEKSKQGIKGYEPRVELSTKMNGDKIMIVVKDNGNGIPHKILDKIFQPFFTTKPTGQGTGLGLSLSYDIVKAHGGELRVESKEGTGSEFIITLPVN